MRRKRLFTTVLILTTFIIALFLALGTLTRKTIDISKDPYQEWDKPIYALEQEETLTWPTIDTDKLSRAFTSYEGNFDRSEFETIFINEFRDGFEYGNSENLDFAFSYDGENINVIVDSNIRMIGSSLVSNPTHEYSYHLKTND